MTGARPETTGLFHNYVSLRELQPDIVTLPQHFIAGGYEAVYCGKIFHQGDTDEGVSWSREPVKRIKGLKKPGGTFALPENQKIQSDDCKAMVAEYGEAAKLGLASGPAYEKADVPDTTYVDGYNTKLAIATLKELVADGVKPFFLAMGYKLPHLNWCAPAKYWDLYDPADIPMASESEGPEGGAAMGLQPAFLSEFVEPVETFVLARGSPESPWDQVFASAPSRFDGDLGIDPNSPGPQRRQAFAKWLVDSENPLTARVMANRLWHHIFGEGIVATPSDFGRAGAMPTNPELLDWLAGEFVASHYATKSMIRMMVMSKAFTQSSHPSEAGLAQDASAQMLWRFPPRRIEAEVIRDSVLMASGRLDDSIGGPSYRIHDVKARYAQWQVVDNYGDETWRRMLYQERMRRVDDRIFTAFDFPDCGQIKAKRPVSTTPLQALNLMNSDFVVMQSKLLADRARSEASGGLPAQVDRCFELLLSRQPSIDEREAAVNFATSESLELLCRTLINTNEFAFLP